MELNQIYNIKLETRVGDFGFLVGGFRYLKVTYTHLKVLSAASFRT